MAEAVIGQVSGEDAKPSGQRVTERGRLSHPADLAKTDETISNPRPGQFFNPAPHPVFEGSFPQHLKPQLTFPSAAERSGGEAAARECSPSLVKTRVMLVMLMLIRKAAFCQ